MEIYLSLLSHGWLRLDVKGEGSKLGQFLKLAPFRLHVFSYDRKWKHYRTSIYELKRLDNLVYELQGTLFVTKEILHLYRRIKFKQSYLKKQFCFPVLQILSYTEMKIPPIRYGIIWYPDCGIHTKTL